MNQDVARNILLNHSRSTKNGVFPETVTHASKITNPFCGDHIELRLFLRGEIIHDLGFKSVACAICSASASLLCQEVKGQALRSVLDSCQLFETAVSERETPWPPSLSNLQCFEHLKINHSRKVCALLPWVALKSALKKPL